MNSDLRILSISDRVCGYHEEYDEDKQPVGDECGRPVTHAVLWYESGQWSPTCDANHEIDAEAPPHITVTIEEAMTKRVEQILARYDIEQVDPL